MTDTFIETHLKMTMGHYWGTLPANIREWMIAERRRCLMAEERAEKAEARVKELEDTIRSFKGYNIGLIHPSEEDK